MARDERFPEDEYRAAVECYQTNPYLGWPTAQEAARRERARKAARPLPEHYARELPCLSDDEAFEACLQYMRQNGEAGAEMVRRSLSRPTGRRSSRLRVCNPQQFSVCLFGAIMATTSEGLSRKQQRCITALLGCRINAEAAQTAGVSERTLYNWFHDPAFMEAFRAARRETESSERELTKSWRRKMEAVWREKVEALVESGNEAIQIAALKLLAARRSATPTFSNGSKPSKPSCMESRQVQQTEPFIDEQEHAHTVAPTRAASRLRPAD
jgi:hypothetical protein